MKSRKIANISRQVHKTIEGQTELLELRQMKGCFVDVTNLIVRGIQRCQSGQQTHLRGKLDKVIQRYVQRRELRELLVPRDRY